MSASPNYSTRFTDRLAFGMVKYLSVSDRSTPPVWIFSVMPYCSGQRDEYVSIRADAKTLRAMRDFLDEAIRSVEGSNG